MRVVLASASPRRRDLLAAAGVAFTIEPSAVDESSSPGASPEEAAVELARRKALAVAERHRGEACCVLGADTIVAVGAPEDCRMLGKPADEREAAAMLRALSDTRHRVITGVCVVRCSDGERSEAFERTWVVMRAIAPAEIEAYVASGEWRDKAGGYAIQEHADAFVVALEEGGFDNVVGLPVALCLRLLARLEDSPDAGLARPPDRG
jgi:septum formation protein